MARVPNTVEILPKIWTAWVGCTSVTDDRRQTDGRAIAYSERELTSEREREFTFTKNYKYTCTDAINACVTVSFILYLVEVGLTPYLLHRNMWSENTPDTSAKEDMFCRCLFVSNFAQELPNGSGSSPKFKTSSCLGRGTHLPSASIVIIAGPESRCSFYRLTQDKRISRRMQYRVGCSVCSDDQNISWRYSIIGPHGTARPLRHSPALQWRRCLDR